MQGSAVRTMSDGESEWKCADFGGNSLIRKCDVAIVDQCWCL